MLTIETPTRAAPQQGPLADLADQARAIAATRSGVPLAQLRVVNQAVETLRELNERVHSFKVLQEATGREFIVDLADDGTERDAQARRAADRAARRQRVGALDDRLATALSSATMDATFDVTITLEPPPWDPPTAPSGKVTDADVRAYAARVIAARQAVLAPVVQRASALLQAEEVSFQQQAESAVLRASVSAAVLKRLALKPEFRTIELSTRHTSELTLSRKVIGADGTRGRGVEGSGVQVAAVEAKGGGYATGNPYLSGVTQGTDPSFWCLSEHTTAVAGVIRSTDSRAEGTAIRGIAAGSSLWVGGDCQGFGQNLHLAEASAHTWGATVINNSWGEDDFGPIQPTLDLQTDDRSEEEHVRDWRTTIVVSAGNRAGCGKTDAYVTSPAKAYNVIAVGAIDSVSTPSWGNDVMNSCSSYIDPNSNHSDREKPEVSAPGTNITTTGNSGPSWTVTMSGTSFAAPMVAGTAAVLQQRDTRLKTEPEAVKAIIMASALANVEGDPRLSDRDGAGALRVNRADDVVRKGQWIPLPHTCGDAADRTLFSMDLEAWARTRVAIAWGEDSDDPNWPSIPNADIDLQVRDPSGGIVASSISFDNTYEIVDFVPRVSGTFSAHAVTVRCNYSPRHLSGAWLQDPGFQPGIARYSAGSRLDAFMLGRDMAVWQRWNLGSGWNSAWNSLGKPASGATSNPYAVWWQNNNRLDVFVQGTDGGLWQRFFCNAAGGIACSAPGWSTQWFSLGGVLTEGPPTAAWTTGDRIDVFVRGGSGLNHILWQYWDAGGWHGWVDLGPTGGTTSAPAAVWWQNNTRLDVYIRGTDYLLWSRYYCTQTGPLCPATGWSDWTKVPLPAASTNVQLGSSPAVSAFTSGDRIDVFMRGTDNQMRQTYWSPGTGGWTDWTVLSGATFISGPGAAWWANNTKIDAFGQADSNILEQRSSSDGVWRDVDYLP